jgi:hypothetical protein
MIGLYRLYIIINKVLVFNRYLVWVLVSGFCFCKFLSLLQHRNSHVLQLQVIQPDVESFLLNEVKTKCTVGLVGGSDFKKIAYQMGGSDEGKLITV